MRYTATSERIMNALAQQWRLHPDLRFGQLMENIKTFSGYEDMYYVEDDEFEALIHDFSLVTSIVEENVTYEIT